LARVKIPTNQIIAFWLRKLSWNFVARRKFGFSCGSATEFDLVKFAIFGDDKNFTKAWGY